MNTGSFKGLQDWHNSGDFETIIELANEKYINAPWRDMGEWAPQQIGTQWNLKVDNIEMPTLPDVAAPFAKGRPEGVSGFSAFSGTIPRLTKDSMVEAADIRTVMEFEYEGNAFVDEIRKMYLKNAERSLGSFHIQLYAWMNEALTSGEISVTAAMNQGLPYKAKFNVPTTNKKTLTTKWFNSDGSEISGSDPIKDLQDMTKAADDANAMVDHFKMSKDLYDKFITHSKVITAVAARISNNSNYKPNKTEMKLQLASGFDIFPIQIVDEKTWKNVNGIPTIAGAHFNKNVVVLCNSGSIFTVRNSIGNFQLIKTPTVDTSTIEDGRIGIRNKYDDDALAEITNYELFAVPVLKNPNNLFIWTVR